MNYNILILRRAQKQLSELNTNTYKNVKKAIQSLIDEPRPLGSKRLTGRKGWRIRAGDYRVIYEIDDDKKEIIVLDIGHRKDIYR